MADIDNLTIRVNATARNATAGIDAMIRTLSRLNGQTNANNSNLGIMNARLNQMTRYFNDVANAARNANTQINLANRGINNSGRSARSGTMGISRFWHALQHINGRTFGRASRVISNGFKTISNAAIGAGKGFVQMLGSAPASMFGAIGKRISDITGRVGKLFKQIGRIAFMRAIRAAIRGITKAISEGIGNLYQWSLLVDRTFADSMDRIAASAQYLKNSIGAMAAPLIESLAPAIDVVVDKFVNAINVVNQFFAAMTGQNVYTAARKIPTEWAENETEKAMKSLKDLKKTILGFDELNVLNKDNRSDAQKNGKTVADYRNMFEVRTVESSIANFAKTIRDAFNSGNWTNIGTIAADKLTGWVNKIDWAGLGTKLGNGINRLVEVYNGFMSKFEFVNLGAKFAGGFNSLLDTVNWDGLGKAFTQKLNAIADTIRGFAANFEWGKAGTIFGSTLNSLFYNFKWSSLTEAFTTGITGIITALQNAVSTFEWGEHGKTFHDNIMNLLDHFPSEDLGNLLSDYMGGALEMMIPTVTDMKFWNKLGAQFALFANKLFKKEWVWENVGKTVNGMLNGILTFGDSFLTEFNTTTAAKNIKTALGEIKWDEIANKLWYDAKVAFRKAGNFLDVLFTDDSSASWDIWGKRYVNNSSSLAFKIGSKISKSISSIDWKQFGTYLSSAVSNIFNAMSDYFQGLVADGSLQKSVQDFFSGIRWDDVTASILESAKSFFWDLGGNLAGAVISGFFDSLTTSLLGDMRTEYSDAVKPGVSPRYMDKEERKQVIQARESTNYKPFGGVFQTLYDVTKNLLFPSASAEGISGAKGLSGTAGNAGPSEEQLNLLDTWNNTYKSLDTITLQGWQKVQQTASSGAQNVVTLTTQPFNNLVNTFFPMKMNDMNRVFGDGLNNVQIIASQRIQGIVTLIMQPLNNLTNIGIPNILSAWNNAFSSGINSMQITTSQGMQGIVTLVLQPLNNLKTFIPQMGWDSIGESIAGGIGKGIRHSWNWLTNLAWNLAVDLYNAACRALGIHSPSKVFEEGVGKMIGLGMAEGITNSTPDIMRSIQDVNNQMLNGLTPYTGAADYANATAANATVQYATQVQQNDNGREVALLQSMLIELRNLNTKEWTTEVTTAAIQRGLARQNRRAGTTTVPATM